MFLVASAKVLWRGAEAAVVADAMIEAHSKIMEMYESFGCSWANPTDGTHYRET